MPIPIRRAPVTLRGCTASRRAVNKVREPIPGIPTGGQSDQTPFAQGA